MPPFPPPPARPPPAVASATGLGRSTVLALAMLLVLLGLLGCVLLGCVGSRLLCCPERPLFPSAQLLAASDGDDACTAACSAASTAAAAAADPRRCTEAGHAACAVISALTGCAAELIYVLDESRPLSRSDVRFSRCLLRRCLLRCRCRPLPCPRPRLYPFPL